MKKQIIVLFGRAQIGKTSTLNILMGLLDEKLKVKDDDLIKDRRESIVYKGKNIAVTTPGDDGYQVSENINFFKGKKCDVFITATRTKGSTVEKLKEYATEIGVEIVWMDKNLAKKLKKEVNTIQAKDIKALIDLFVEGN
ncbi:hypothetical protein [Ornithobacterium rhinotracheale]|uniref:G domain-containing protein n=1 Tax=Ornithobacterium rhinotracheale TaxID=28251 RepID=A0A3R5XTJ4_ORNRH|nr:hypothetical protein [Ornithobacterium rhinotracheale]QAR30123.1 hypothetical protein EQP59_01480 [Ornithobacterium rhinotracheale]